MAYVHPLAKKRQMRVDERPDIEEVRVAVQKRGPDAYLCRPRELLCLGDQVKRLTDRVEKGSDGRRPNKVVRVDPSDHAGLNVARVELEERPDFEGFVPSLRRGGDLDVCPNYVFPAAPAYQGCPDGEPEPPEPLGGFAFEPARGGGPVVAVVDTYYTWGVYPDDLDPRIDRSASAPDAVNKNEALDENPPNSTRDDCAGHTLFIAGIIAEACPAATITLHPVLDSDGYTDDWRLCKALLACKDADVINVSLGGTGRPRVPPVCLKEAVALIRRSGKAVIVAAVGNDGNFYEPGRRERFYPAHLELELGTPLQDRIIVGVGALTHSGAAAPYTNFPADQWALGDSRSTFFRSNVSPVVSKFEGEALWNGTSFAAPRIAAEIACAIADGRPGREFVRDLLSNPPPAPPPQAQPQTQA